MTGPPIPPPSPYAHAIAGHGLDGAIQVVCPTCGDLATVRTEGEFNRLAAAHPRDIAERAAAANNPQQPALPLAGEGD